MTIPHNTSANHIPPKRLSKTALGVSSLTLYNYRNYTHARIETLDSAVVITGGNGSGKTNILEAVSLLTPGRGIRNMPSHVFANCTVSESIWGVSGECETFVGTSTIGTGYDPQNPTRRMVRINHEKHPQNTLGEYMSCVWLTPQMDKLFLESPAHRRRFFDRLVLGYDTAHAGRIQGYEKNLRNRSKVLKMPHPDPAWLRSMEKDIARRAVAIGAARILMCDRLNHIIKDGDTHFPKAYITLDGVIETMLRQKSALHTEEFLTDSLHASRPQDTIHGGATIGIHKTDIQVQHTAKNTDASLCSTGEQKALLIAIILGHLRLQKAETGRLPVLLLDEISAHLDETRLNALFEAIAHIGPQTWYTGLNAQDFTPILSQCTPLRIDNNSIQYA